MKFDQNFIWGIIKFIVGILTLIKNKYYDYLLPYEPQVSHVPTYEWKILSDFNFTLSDAFNNFTQMFTCRTEWNIYNCSGDTSIKYSNNQLYLKIGPYENNTFHSMRVQSSINYNANTLFVLKAFNIPKACALWPAWWTSNDNVWPYGGEIDVIETINNMPFDQSTLHTGAGCSMEAVKAQVATDQSIFTPGTNLQAATSCFVSADNQGANQGCPIIGLKTNAQQGVYAMEWIEFINPLNEKEGRIRMYFWNYLDARVTINGGPLSESPNIDSWNDNLYANFILSNINCPMSNFYNQQLVFDTVICGSSAGGAFEYMCPFKGTCQEYADSNAFKEIANNLSSQWVIDNLRVFNGSIQSTTQ